MKREAAAVKRDTRMKAWKEKKQAAEKKKKEKGVKEKLKEKERVTAKGQQKITAWMSKTSKRRPPRSEKTVVH